MILAVLYDHDPLAELDHDVAEWVAAELPAWAEAFARPFSWLGGWIGLTIVGVVAGIWLVRERAWLDLAFLLGVFVGVQVAVLLLKDGFDRARPDVGSAVPLPESSAFPSGHAAAGVASLGAVAVLLAERLPSRKARAWVLGGTVVLAVAVGASRVALNVHFVTDVLAGWCFGLAWLAGCLLLRETIRVRASPSPV